MGSYLKDVQRYIRQFKRDTGKSKYTPKEIARWIIEKGYWDTPLEIAVQKCAEDVSRALHDMHSVDPQGRKVRTEYVLYSEKEKQLPIWGDWEKLTRDEMAFSFKGIRKGILANCKRLKTHVDSYNENVNPDPRIPIQLGFDFTFELQLLELGEQVRDETKKASDNERSRPSPRFPVAARQSVSERVLPSIETVISP